jgi:hypothetical protein
MKKPQLKSLVFCVIVMTVVLSAIPAAMAYRERQIKIRPIEDWLLANNLVNDLPMGGMPDYDKGLTIWPHLADPTYAPVGYYIPPLTCDYHGIIVERKLSDNEILVSINLHVKDAPFYILSDFAGDILTSTHLFHGTMDYLYQLRFTIDLDTVGPDDYDEDGNIIYKPWWWYVWVLYNLKSVFLCARGSGEFLTSYEGWEEGDTAKMTTNVFFLVVGEDYTGPNPYYNLQGLNAIVLGNMINFH